MRCRRVQGAVWLGTLARRFGRTGTLAAVLWMVALPAAAAFGHEATGRPAPGEVEGERTASAETVLMPMPPPPSPSPLVGRDVAPDTLPSGAVSWSSLTAPPALGAMMQGGGGSGGGPAIEYYALDALGSVRVVFDADGAVKARADYEPFGAPIATSTTGPLPREQFTGQQRDSEVGLDYFGARFYHATHGRMLTVDPLYRGAVRNPQRWNRYAHVLNNPLSLVDPDGRDMFRVETIGNCGGTCFPNTTQFEVDWINAWASLTGGDYTTAGVDSLPSWMREPRQGPTSADYAEAFDPKQNSVPMWEPDDPAIESADMDLFDAVSMVAGMIGPKLTRGMLVRMVGDAGEGAVARILKEAGEEVGEKLAYQVAGRRRIADFATDTVLREVKNLGSGRMQYFTRQLRDATLYAMQTNRTFELWIPSGAKVSDVVQTAHDAGLLKIVKF